MSRTTWILTLTLVGLAALGACGGPSDGDGERATVAEVSDALKDGPVPSAESGTDDYRQCVAESLVSSDLSDRWLAVFVGLTDEKYKPSGPRAKQQPRPRSRPRPTASGADRAVRGRRSDQRETRIGTRASAGR